MLEELVMEASAAPAVPEASARDAARGTNKSFGASAA
jgi:hypothetical protein